MSTLLLPEHARGHVLGLTDLDQRINAMEDQLITLRSQRQELIDSIAREVAEHQVGEEYETRNGVRIRITKVKGDYFESDLTPEPIVWVRYLGVRLYKKGTEGREETVYPPTATEGSK